MRTTIFSFAAIAIFAFSSFTRPVSKLDITSSAFPKNGPIPIKYTCKGGEASPPLHIEGIPAGTRSLAIIVFDPDAVIKVNDNVMMDASMTPLKPKGKVKHKKTIAKESSHLIHGYTHWLIWNIDPSADIPENFRSDHVGMNSAHERNYKGMCPPAGTHTFKFIVYALDTQLNIGTNSDKAAVEAVMDSHILGKGELTGMFNKDYK